MKNKNGFTLIELLAVIVILAIIALIAVPIVLNMINQARKSAARSSALGYVDAIEYNNGFAEIGTNGYTSIKGDNLDTSDININLKGKKPDSGIITINSSGKVVSADLCIYGYEVIYEDKDARVVGNSCSNNSNKTTIIFDSNGGSEVQPITARKGSSISLPTPTKDNSGFAGWYTQADGGDKITSNMVPDENVTYYAHWASEIASVGNLKYASVFDAMNSIDSTGTVVLLVNHTENVTTPNDKTITLDLNGKTLNGKFTNNSDMTLLNGNMNNDTGNAIINNGNLTINSGRYTNAASNAGVISNRGQLIVNNGEFTSQSSTVVTTNAGFSATLKGGTYHSNKSNGQVIYNSGTMNVEGGTYTGANKIVHNLASGTINISGGTLETTSSGGNVIANLGTVNISGTASLSGNSQQYSAISTQANSTLNISGGEISSNHNVIIAYDGNTTTITGGRVVGNNTNSYNAISLKSGSVLDISGGEIVSTTTGCVKSESGATIYVKGGQLKVENSSNANNVINNYGRTEISGGTIVSESGTVAALHNKDTGTMIITDGTITTSESQCMALYSVGNLTVSGGTFTSTYYAIYASGTRSVTGGTFNGPTHY